MVNSGINDVAISARDAITTITFHMVWCFLKKFI